MCNEGGYMFNAHDNELFMLRAILLCTLNEFTTYNYLSGYIKGKKHAQFVSMTCMEAKWIPKCINMYS